MPKSDALSRNLWSRVAHLAPRARLDALLDVPDAAAAVRATPTGDLFLTVMEVGLADATDIVQLASREQFRGFVDLGGWRRDRMDPHEVLTWIRAARGDDVPAYLEKVHALDAEVLESLFRHFLVIHDLEENPDVNPEGVTLETPEGRYLVEIKAEGAELAALRALLNDLIGENPFEAVRFLESVRWEVPSELEETAYRFRTARLSDLGFPAPEEAARLFSYAKPGPAPQASASGAGSALQAPERVNYVERALLDLEPLERENLALELRAVSNAAIVAEATDPGNLEAVRAVGEKVRDYLSLGLEHLSGGNPAKGADVFRDHPVRDVFQVGFSLTLELKFRADRLAKEPLARIGTTYLLLPEEAAAVRALRQPRPLRALKVDGAEPVPFRSRQELEQTRQLLARAEAQRAFFAALFAGNEAAARLQLATFGADLEALDFGAVMSALVAHAVLDGAVHVEPLPEGRLTELGERLFDGEPSAPRIRPEAHARAQEVITAIAPESARAELGRVVDMTLERLRTELGAAYLRERRLGAEAEAVLPIRRL